MNQGIHVMPTNTHTTATVRLVLDLGGLITQLRELADTLEATQHHDPQTGADDDPRPPLPANCERCGTSYDTCTRNLHHPKNGTPCCPTCSYYRGTHEGQDPWEQWHARHRSDTLADLRARLTKAPGQ